MLQGVVVYVDDLIIAKHILNIVEKYHTFPKFLFVKPNGAGSLFYGILVTNLYILCTNKTYIGIIS